MPNVMTVVQSSNMMKQRRVRYNTAFSGAYVQAVRGTNVGEVLNLGAAVGKYDPEQYWGVAGPTHGDPSQPPAGYTAEIIPGADGTHWLYKIFSAPGVELAAGNYPAAITADLDAFVEFWGGSFK